MRPFTHVHLFGRLAVAVIFILLTIQYGAKYAGLWIHHTALPRVAVTAEAAVTGNQSAIVPTQTNAFRTEHLSDDAPRPYGPPALIFQSNGTTFRAVHQIVAWDAGSQTWTAVSPDLTDVNVDGAPGYGIDGITAIATNNDTWYVGTLVGRIVTKHPHTGWTPSQTGAIPDRTVTALAIDADFQDGSVAAAGFAGYGSSTPGAPGHVYLTMDGGLTWVDISGSLPDEPVQRLVFAHRDGHVSLCVQQSGKWRQFVENGQWISLASTP